MLKIHLTIGVAMFSALLASTSGCRPTAVGPKVAGDTQLSPPVSVYHLAQRLGMHVDDCGATRAVLRNQGNTVVIYGEPQCAAYVNGRAVANSGIYASDNVMYVSGDLESRIRSNMARVSVPHHTPPAVTQATVPQVPPSPTGQVRGRVVIDAGHGGKDPGTSGGGLVEKDVNLIVARMVAQMLKQRGVEVVMTRDKDEFIKLEDRADLANRMKADLFVSIHCNWSPKSHVSGYMLYVAEGGSSESFGLARSIDHQMSSERIERYGRESNTANFRVLVDTQCPAVLVELGFVSNSADARRLASSAYQRQLASAIAEATAECLQGK